MPAYNTEKYIGEAIQSVLEQTHLDFDLVVVDDGSTDRTIDVASQLIAGTDHSIIMLPSNQGVAGATKMGIQFARGPIVTVVDSDDKITPGALSVVLPHFEVDPELGFAWTQFKMSGSRLGWTRPLPGGADLLTALTRKGWWNASHQRFFRKSYYEKSPGMTGVVPHASDFQLAVLMGASGCKTKFIQQVTYWYRRVRPGSITSNRRAQRNCQYVLIDWAKRGFDNDWLESRMKSLRVRGKV